MARQTRHRARRGEYVGGAEGATSGAAADGGDVDMGDVARITLPEATPQNADGTFATEGDVSEEQAHQIGALNVESAAKNKSMARKMRDKALGKSVPWNVADALELFSYVKTVFAVEWESIIILVARHEPAPKVQYPPVMASNILDPLALYNYVKQCHGQQGAATYKVSFRSSSGAERGAANVCMPDTTAPPVVQVLNPGGSSGGQPPPAPPQPQYAPPPPSPYGMGGMGGMGGGYGVQGPGYPPPGYWPQPPQQAQPQQQQERGDRIIVVQQPQPQQPPMMPAPPPAPAPAPVQAAPPPPPQYIYPPPLPPPPAPPAPVAAPGAFDPQRALFEMMQLQNSQAQAQNERTMAMIEKIGEKLNRPAPPPPPPGFIALPENYPVPQGYFRVPGGIVPLPAYAQPQPVGVGAAPVAYVPPAPAPAAVAPAPVIYQAPPAPPPPSFDQQIAGTVGTMKSVVKGMGELQSLFAGFSPQPRQPIDDELEPDEPPPQQNPMMTQDVGGVTMAISRETGKTDWPTTLIGALPKIGETAKSVFTEYQKAVRQQHDLTVNAMRQRTEMANAFTRAQQSMQPQVLPAVQPQQQTPQAQPRPPVQQQPQPPQQARPPVGVGQIAPPARKPAVSNPVPTGPIWGS